MSRFDTKGVHKASAKISGVSVYFERPLSCFMFCLGEVELEQLMWTPSVFLSRYRNLFSSESEKILSNEPEQVSSRSHFLETLCDRALQSGYSHWELLNL